MTPFTLDWWGFVAIFVACLALTFWAGVEWCRSTHRQKGLEVDDWRYSLPPDRRSPREVGMTPFSLDWWGRE